MKLTRGCWTLAFGVMALLLSGCGGGGDGGGGATSNTVDTTAPTTTAAPAVSGTTDTETTLSVTVNENGTGYYLMQPAAASVPTVTDVQAGTSFALTANVPATPAISGLIFNTAYTIYFVAKDTSNNVQAAVQSVAVSTPLTAGYVSQGGLTWMPVTFYDTWTNADAYCNNTIINGVTGWRMPTEPELSALYTSGALNGQGWTLGSTWSSTQYSAGFYYFVSLHFGGFVSWVDDTNNLYVSCVRDFTSPTTTAALAVSGITDSATTLSVTVNENGTGYYLVQPAAASAPTATAVQAGTSFALTANVPATPTISGLIFNTPYTIYFVAKDAANNVQAAVQSVPVTTAPTTTAGYVTQGGLTWMPVTFYDTWTNANTYCTTTTINGVNGWRMPTKLELSALYSSGAMNGQGWTLYITWSSTQDGALYHYGVNLYNGTGHLGYNPTVNYVSCVH